MKYFSFITFFYERWVTFIQIFSQPIPVQWTKKVWKCVGQKSYLTDLMTIHDQIYLVCEVEGTITGALR